MNTTQNPKLTFIEKLIETLGDKVLFALEEQARLAFNPQRAEEGAILIESNLSKAFQNTFEKTGKDVLIFSKEENPEMPEGFSGWLITPVVSRMNLIRSSGAISSAFVFVEEGVARFAAVWQPATRTLAYATKGFGAFHAKEGRLRVSKAEELTNGIMMLPWATSDAAQFLQKALDSQMHTRKTGCFAQDVLTFTSGRADVLVATQTTPCQEAVVTLFTSESGGKISFNGNTIVASNLDIHKSAATLL